LRSSLSIDPRRRFLGISGTRETDIGKLRSQITVMTLVDDKGVLGNGGRVDLVCVEEVDEFGLGGLGFG